MKTLKYGALAVALALTACAKEPSKKGKDQQATSKVDAGAASSATAGDLPPPPDVAAPPPDAQKTTSGLASKVLAPGKGTERPNAWDEVTVHYTGWTTDGKMFDSSVKRGQPATFSLNGVIAGWTEGLQLMVAGEKRRFWVPEALAYQGKRPPHGTLVFDVELLGIKRGVQPPPTPPDVAAAPADAQKSASGLASKVLAKGKGKTKPTLDSIVRMHYTGWTSDGKLVDSSITRGTPVTFPLRVAPPGFQEGLPLMVEGEKRRFWMTPKHAARGAQAPPGSMVFDVELIQVTNLDTPRDVKAAPKDAQRTASGLASKILRKGTGAERPKATSVVEVHYAGWTTDGKLFDSSYSRGQPAKFALNAVIPGWTEGVQLMTVGEKRRFWIPEELAYKGKSGPQGTLVFDVELLSVQAPPSDK